MELMQLQSPKSFNLYAIVVQLGAVDRGYLPQTLGRAIHAQVLQWLNKGDPNVAEFVHESQESPISLSGLIGNRRPSGIRPGDEFYFRISLLNGSLIDPLLSGIEQWGNEPITLGKFTFTIKGFYSLPGTHPWVGSADYGMLAKLPNSANEITLEFLSPTSFKQTQYIQPFPLPELVFFSLQRRWNFFAPEALKIDAISWQSLVCAYQLETHALKMEGGAEIGAKGWVKYRFPDAEQARIANILAHFAFFAGVGRKTSMGMGQTKLIH
ncbi:CRISPR-associated endoribonuclease Cas6 [Planktothrix sp. FACHB-1355]|uniref:CRISPR-associated endoribonuclease Cas6 n=1 Tax=Aerosakkonema funiforme FACHB-1375 TaxID=2949571 RepID=A0A926ZJF5_9CYAN|nr:MULTISPECIES: CRISPR-associated endoribonuclease Cas6 [Oscillatoriales]MBD2184614.1 CRISPR-associated endoribonuclease Cas6 [Aerosakkonema funiforme FACHB-1375]MBD3562078.1 CRISPR-associated endoribonuclease Cas6 [Planktothrix sp. FACHB-1355]